MTSPTRIPKGRAFHGTKRLSRRIRGRIRRAHRGPDRRAAGRHRRVLRDRKAPPHPRATRLALWYDKPAGQWLEARCPLGNGRLGAMVFGGADREQLQLNEDTLWAGGPYEPANPQGLANLPEIRRRVFAGEVEFRPGPDQLDFLGSPSAAACTRRSATCAHLPRYRRGHRIPAGARSGHRGGDHDVHAWHGGVPARGASSAILTR